MRALRHPAQDDEALLSIYGSPGLAEAGVRKTQGFDHFSQVLMFLPPTEGDKNGPAGFVVGLVGFPPEEPTRAR